MTSKEVSALTGLSIQRVQQFARSNPGLVEKIGRDYIFNEAAVEALQERKGKTGQPKNPDAKYSRYKNERRGD